MPIHKPIEIRRCRYDLKKESPISDEKIVELITYALKHAPAAFNVATANVMVLFGEQHDALWDKIWDNMKANVPKESLVNTEEKINGFKAGYGTMLFFEDTNKVKQLEEQFELYAHNFAPWSQQGLGISQYIVWTALSVEGLGCSLQHYNELVEEDIKKKYNIPAGFKLISQMVFGTPTGPAPDKEFNDYEKRIRVEK